MIVPVSAKRTRNYLRQIRGAIVYRAAAAIASYASIPMMVHYLGGEQFGIWSTLLTVMSWIVFFDLGIGNGLRNQVAAALATGNSHKARGFISSAYTLIGFFALAIWIVVVTVSYFIPWQVVFNTQNTPEALLRQAIQIASFFIALNFWMGLITALQGAIQQTSLVALGQLIANLLLLILIVGLIKTTDASIVGLAAIHGASLVVASCAMSFWFYRKRPELRPRIELNLQHVKPLVTVGLEFFVIQLAVLVIFTTDKILISQIFGPAAVMPYEIVFKLFGIILFAHGLISMPLWSAYTDAFHREDFPWIRQMLHRQLLVMCGVLISIAMLMPLSKPIISAWIGQELQISTELIISMGLFVFVSVWNNVFSMLINGIGKIRLQLYTAVVAMLINIPLSIFLAKNTSLGIAGIVVGTACSLLFPAIVLPLQVRSLLRDRR